MLFDCNRENPLLNTINNYSNSKLTALASQRLSDAFFLALTAVTFVTLAAISPAVAQTGGTSAVTSPSLLIAGGGTVEGGKTADFHVVDLPRGTLSFQWQKEGVDIPDETTSQLWVPVRSQTQAGDYRLRVKTMDGEVLSNSLTLVVPPITQLAFLEQPHNADPNPGQSPSPQSATIYSPQGLTLKVKTVGQGKVYYLWFQGSSGDTTQPIITQFFNFSDEFTVPISAYGVFKYWVKASDKLTTVDSDTFTVTVLEKMTATYEGDTRLQVHKNVIGGVKAPGATQFKAEGLPAGVFVNPNTGEIYGTPSSMGRYTVRFSAGNGFASSAVTVPMEVAPLDKVVTGSFQGVIERDGVWDKTMGGQISFTITPSGIYSGRFSVGNITHSFIGIASTTNDGGLHALADPAPSSPNPKMGIEFFVSHFDGSIDGWIFQPDTYGQRGVPFHAVRNAWVAGGLRSTPYHGTINAALQTVDLTPIMPGDYPEGYGTFCANVGVNGGVSISARLADNTVVTASSIMGQDHSIPFYSLIYGRTGSIQGWQTVEADSTFGNRTNGKLTWVKYPQPTKTATRSYANGLPVLEINLTGNKLQVPSKDQILLGLQDKLDNAVIEFVHTKLVGSNSTTFRITKANVAQIPGGTNVTLVIDKATGKFSGTWSPSGFVAPFSGVFVDRLKTGFGCFQFPAASGNSSPLLSGAVRIQAGP